MKNAKANAIEVANLFTKSEVGYKAMKESPARLANCVDFRKASIAMVNALDAGDFKNQAQMVKDLESDKNTISRYIKAGRFLASVTSAQLKKVGLDELDVRALTQSLDSHFVKATEGKKGAESAKALKEAKSTKAKTRSRQSVAPAQSVTLDVALRLIDTFLQNCPEHAKVSATINALEASIIKAKGRTYSVKSEAFVKGIVKPKVNA
jgi:hypothetical protein